MVDLFGELKALGLDEDDYVVVGSGAMAARGLRSARDIDLVVTEAVFGALGEWGWTAKTRPDGKPSFVKGRVEAYLEVGCGAFNPPTDWLFENAELLAGVRFIPLGILRQFKQAYGRPKDLDDLVLIDAVLAQKVKTRERQLEK